jgi:hypothetical protein
MRGVAIVVFIAHSGCLSGAVRRVPPAAPGGAGDILTATCHVYSTLPAYADRGVVVVEGPRSDDAEVHHFFTRMSRPSRFIFEVFSVDAVGGIDVHDVAWNDGTGLRTYGAGADETVLETWLSAARGTTRFVSWVVPMLLETSNSFLCASHPEARVLGRILLDGKSSDVVSVVYEGRRIVLWIDVDTHLVRRWRRYPTPGCDSFTTSGAYAIDAVPTFDERSFVFIPVVARNPSDEFKQPSRTGGEKPIGGVQTALEYRGCRLASWPK